MMSLTATMRNGLTVFNIVPFPETHKSKGDEPPGSTGCGSADPLSIGPVAAAIAADLVFRVKVQRVVAKGERPIVELLAEIAARYSCTGPIDRLLDRYLALPDEALDAMGARDFPPVPIHGVTG